MADATLLDQVKDPKNRADPYPLFARLRETPVSRQHDGTLYLIGASGLS
jgi:hypothetical protein